MRVVAWPSGLCTTTSTAPAACAGVSALMSPALVTTTLVAARPPMGDRRAVPEAAAGEVDALAAVARAGAGSDASDGRSCGGDVGEGVVQRGALTVGVLHHHRHQARCVG